MTETMERDWVGELSSPEPSIKNNAAGDLRAILFRGLKAAYAHSGVDDAFCEDIAQDATIRVLDRMHQFEGRSKFTTWAMTVAVRLAVSEFRRKRFKDISLEAMAGSDSLRFNVPAATDSPGDQGLRIEIMNKLKSLIDNLSEKQRIAMQALLNGMPVDVVAEKTDNNRNAVYKLVYDARKSLKKGFEQSGYSWDDIQQALAGGA